MSSVGIAFEVFFYIINLIVLCCVIPEIKRFEKHVMKPLKVILLK